MPTLNVAHDPIIIFLELSKILHDTTTPTSHKLFDTLLQIKPLNQGSIIVEI